MPARSCDRRDPLDAYQNSLVEALFEFHVALGGSAILIAATLTVAPRQLVNAFAKSAACPAPKLCEPHFPQLSMAWDTENISSMRDEGHTAIFRSSGSQMAVRLRLCSNRPRETAARPSGFEIRSRMRCTLIAV